MKKPVKSSFQYLSISYELALAIGSSLDLPEMLNEVIYKAVHKTNAHRGIFLVKNEKNKFQPLASAGISINDVLKKCGKKISNDLYSQILQNKQYVLIYKNDKDFLQYCPVISGKEESVLIVPITDVAILYLVYTSREIADEPLANLFTSLSMKLGVAIKACMTHNNLINEVQVRVRTEKELEKKTKKLFTSEKEFQKLYGESEIARKSLLSILEDIMQKENALKESEKKFRSIFENKGTATGLFGNDSIIRDCNTKFTELCGFQKEEIIDKMKWSDFVVKEDLEKLQKYHSQPLKTGNPPPSQYECRITNNVDKIIDVIVSIAVSEIDRIVSITDISERKKAEQIQKVLYNISNAVITTDNLEKLIKLIQEELGTIIDTTNFYIALYDKKTNTYLLPFFKDEKDSLPSSFPAGKTLTHYVIRTEKSLLATNKELTILQKNGDIESFGSNSEIWLGVPFKIEGKVTGVLAVQSYDDEKAYDKSDLKMLEIVSHQISISLERKKAEQDLKSALEMAQESDRLKSAFLSNMSHEIRTPMNGILGFTDLLKEPQLSGEEMDKYIQIIEKSGNRMLNTINDIIDISKVEAGQVEVIKAEVSVNKILEEQYEFFNSEAQSKGIELISESTLSDKESTIVTDKHKLEGILSNLIKNAIKFTEHGNISFGYSLKKEKNFEGIEFYIKDTGVGIPSDRIEAIFNRFEQADIEDAGVYEGSGLGLAISKSYVEMLGGNISVISEGGFGSTFTFTIPYTRKGTKENDIKGSVKIDQQAALKNLSVIIAEDDETSQLLLKVVFKNKFQKITFTKTGKETIEKFRENPETDVILMDLKMPVMSGYEATREIRKFNQDVVIIAQTAYGLSGDRKKAIEAGCNDYIAKPIKANELKRMIIKYLKKQ